MNSIKQKTIQLLDLFRVKHANSAYEERMTKYIPVMWEGRKWIGACNPHSFILVCENEENKMPEIDPIEKTVNLQGILPHTIIFEAELNKQVLLRLLDKVPMIETDEMAECPSCEGVGRFKHWGDTYDCQHCQETGEIKTNHKIKVRDPEYGFTIDDKIFQSQGMEKLVETINVSEAENIRYLPTKGNEGMLLFSLDGDVIVGLARWRPLTQDKHLIALGGYCMYPKDISAMKTLKAKT